MTAENNAHLEPPRSGWATPCKVVGVHDGDTVTVEVTRRFQVRLKDCWAPEVGKVDGFRRVSAEERERGNASKLALEGILNASGDVTLFIPTASHGESNVVEPSLSFGRVVGEIWKDGLNVSDEMVRTGFATAKKA